MKKPNRAKTGKWPDQHRYDYEFARQILLDHGEIAPMFIVHSGRIIIMLGQWKNPEDKDNTVRMLRIMALAEDAQCVSFISEAWVRDMSRFPGETEAEHLERATAISPSQAEDRKEIILVQTEYWDKDITRTLSCSAEIVRNLKGRPSGVINYETGQLQSGSRFAHFLPKRRPTPDERELAQSLLAHMGTVVPGSLM